MSREITGQGALADFGQSRLALALQLGAEQRWVAREDEAEADAAFLADRRVVQVVRLDQPLEIAATGHVAEPALVDEAVVDQRIDDPVAEDSQAYPGTRPPGARAHDPLGAHGEHGDAHRRADEAEQVV